MAELSILIPTYNRAPKLLRLLHNIETEIGRLGLDRQVDVLISDNASTDSTPEVVSSFRPTSFRLLSFRQKENLGLDGNMQFLYQRASSQYVWYFADDDILLPGSIGTVADVLKTHSPDALVFSFTQPPESRVRTFDYPERVKIVEEPIILIELLAQYPKISIYVLKRIDLSADERGTLEVFLGTNYYFVALAYSILARSRSPKLCVISDPVATCDLEFIYTRFEPEVWGNVWRIFKHPYVVTHAPGLARAKERANYYNMIQFLFAARVGAVIPENRRAYDTAMKNLDCRLSWLVLRPRSLLQFALLKMELTVLYPLYRRIRNMAEPGYR